MKLLNALAYVAMIATNILANVLPLNSQTQAAISEKYPVLLTPAGYAFSIWGLIYVLLGAFVLHDVFARTPRMRRVGWLFVLTCLANIGWIFAWHWDMVVASMGFMLILLVTLFVLTARMRRYEPLTVFEQVSVDVAFSVYFGWISVASLVNLSVLLYTVNAYESFPGPEGWTAIMLVLAAVAAVSVLGRRGDVAYVLVIIWALVGVALANPETPLVFGLAWGSAAGLGIRLSYRCIRRAGFLASR